MPELRSTVFPVPVPAFQSLMRAVMLPRWPPGAVDFYADSWNQMARAMNHMVIDFGTNQQSTWRYANAETGAAKTTSLAVYLALLRVHAPAVNALVLTRRVDQIEDLVETIHGIIKNNLGMGDTIMAVGRHHEVKDTVDKLLPNFQVVVASHKAYQVRLKQLALNVTGPMNSLLLAKSGPRQLIVIDELIDAFSMAALTNDDFALLEGSLAGMDANSNNVIENIKIDFADVTRNLDGANTMTMVPQVQGKDRAIKLDPIKNHIRENEAFRDNALVRRLGAQEDARQALVDIVTDIETVNNADWVLASNVNGFDKVSTAKVIIPGNWRGALVFDGTSAVHPFYRLFDRAVAVPIERLKNYGNATIHFTPTPSYGKGGPSKDIKLWAGELARMMKGFGENAKTLVITTSETAERYRRELDRKTSGNFRVDHWGNTSGTNDYRDFTHLFVLSVWHKPKDWAPLVHRALDKGWEDTTELFNTYEDDMIAEFIQLINRVNVRMMTIEDGKPMCPKCDIFCMVPETPAGARLLDTIAREMPGVRFKHDNLFEAVTLNARKTNQQKLIDVLKAVPVGEKITVKAVSELTRITAGVMANMVAEIKKPSMIRCILSSLGITFKTERQGRSTVSFFQK